jgi:hypothetical protein
MVRHDQASMPVDEFCVLHEPDVAVSAEPATPPDQFHAQMYSSERLNEYYKQVVAEILASLDRTQDESSESLLADGG